jgi:tetratricopeptide (TPR) repeat protein
MTYFRRDQYERAVADLKQAKRQDRGRNAEAAQNLHEAYLRWSERLAAAGKHAEAQQMLAKADELQQDALAESSPADADASSTSESAPFVPRPGPDTPRELRAKPVLSGEESHGLEAEVHLRAGKDLLQQGDADGALRELTAAIALEPKQAVGYAERAAVWLQLGFADNALLDVEDALRSGDTSAEHYRLKADVLLALDDSIGATMAASEAIRRDPADARNFAVRGTAYLRSDKFNQAIRDLRYAAEKDVSLKDKLRSTLAEAYILRGKSHKQAGRAKDAEADFGRAAELGWTVAPATSP